MSHLRGVELTAPADACDPVLLAKKDGEPPLARIATIPARAGIAWFAECEAEGRTWLVTPEMTLIPRDRVARSLASTAHGIERPGTEKIAFVTGKPRPRYRMVRYGYFEATEPLLPVYATVRLTGQTHAVGPSTYLETSDGGAYVLADHVAAIEPVVRPAAGGETECGLVYDCWTVAGRPGYSATVFLCNLFLMPTGEEAFLGLPRRAYDTPEELLADGWRVD